MEGNLKPYHIHAQPFTADKALGAHFELLSVFSITK